MFHVHLTVLYFEVRRHFTPDKLFEDCAVGLGVYTTHACTMVEACQQYKYRCHANVVLQL